MQEDVAMSRFRFVGPRRGQAVGLFGLALALSLVKGVAAQDATPLAGVTLPPGSLTQERPYIVANDPNTLEITPLITSGEMVDDYQFAGVPDGLGAYKGSDGNIVLFVNHELTTDEDDNISDSRVSRLVIDGTTGAVISGSYVLDGTEGYRRLCSASWSGTADGFDPGVFLTGEESTNGKGGLSLAISADGQSVTELPWLGHLNHENEIVMPGFQDQTVVITTDDNADGSELYMYVGASPEDILAGNGQLYVFKGDESTNTADISKGTELTGKFVPIDQADNADAEALQTAAEAAGAFAFVRLEDVTYDRNESTKIYFTDTGDNEAPNLATPTGAPLTANGRLYEMTLDPSDPTTVTGFKLLLDGDAGDDILNPDNIDANATTVMILEDRNGYNRGAGDDHVGRVLAYDIASSELSVLAKIDQSDDPATLTDSDVDGGEWETSGIINAEDLFGPGTWLIDVQAHTIDVPQLESTDEGGQLLLLKTK
jgi:Alkaline phosphatase PhoX